jgi:hypothetical protein
MSVLFEPSGEDDCPEDISIVPTAPFPFMGDNIALNYIRDQGQDNFRPLNAQLNSPVTPKDI